MDLLFYVDRGPGVARAPRVVAATYQDMFDLRGPGVYAATQCMCAVRQ